MHPHLKEILKKIAMLPKLQYQISKLRVYQDKKQVISGKYNNLIKSRIAKQESDNKLDEEFVKRQNQIRNLITSKKKTNEIFTMKGGKQVIINGSQSSSHLPSIPGWLEQEMPLKNGISDNDDLLNSLGHIVRDDIMVYQLCFDQSKVQKHMKKKENKQSLAEFLASSHSKKMSIQERVKRRQNEVFSPKDYLSPRKKINTLYHQHFPSIDSPNLMTKQNQPAHDEYNVMSTPSLKQASSSNGILSNGGDLKNKNFINQNSAFKNKYQLKAYSQLTSQRGSIISDLQPTQMITQSSQDIYPQNEDHVKKLKLVQNKRLTNLYMTMYKQISHQDILLTDEDEKKNKRVHTKNDNSEISEEFSDDDYQSKNNFFITSKNIIMSTNAIKK